MKEEKVDKILDMLIAGLEKTTELANSELPKLLDEYVVYLSIEAIPVAAFIGIIMAMAATIYIYKHRKSFFADEPDGEWKILVLLLIVVVWGFSLGGFIRGTEKFAKLYYAPKATLMEKFRGK